MSRNEPERGSIHLVRSRFARLHYRVLSHLDLGDDRANLFDPGLPDRAWVPRLADAYRSTPHRDLVQVLPLWFVGRGEGDVTVGDVLDSLRDATGDDELAGALADAYRGESAQEAPRPADDSGGRDPSESLESIREPLARLRAELWSEVDGSVPDLRLVDVPALKTPGGWTRGRGHSAGGGRIVAVSLGVRPVRSLLQVLHEEVHPVTDPVVRHAGAPSDRDTPTPESLAIETGRALVESVIPELAEDYAAWQRRFDHV